MPKLVRRFHERSRDVGDAGADAEINKQLRDAYGADLNSRLPQPTAPSSADELGTAPTSLMPKPENAPAAGSKPKAAHAMQQPKPRKAAATAAAGSKGAPVQQPNQLLGTWVRSEAAKQAQRRADEASSRRPPHPTHHPPPRSKFEGWT